MKLLVGLGNLGDTYAKTRHNLGYMVIGELAIRLSGDQAAFKPHRKAKAGVLEGDDWMLVKPTTMMNLSGEAVQRLMSYYNLPPEDVWVVYDDVDLPFGQLRVRLGGSSGGHNGVKSVIQHCGHDFWRIRLGVRNDHFAATATDRFVLSKFTPEEQEKLPEIIAGAAETVQAALRNGEPEIQSRDLA